jgi:cytochrome c oxidase cbb3-type subunit 3
MAPLFAVWNPRSVRHPKRRLALAAPALLALGACSQTAGPPASAAEGSTISASAEPEDFGEYLARPEQVAAVPTNDIVKSLRLNGEAMTIGKAVYARSCAQCHGEDLRGSTENHGPSLIDSAHWRFSGDDLESGGVNKLPTDVEWTVRYGIRSGHPKARGVEADMLAYDPQYRNQHDIMDYGTTRYLSEGEIEDVAEYVLKISHQQADPARAARGEMLFNDNTKGNCTDCHTEEATGNAAIGSTNLTDKSLYLYGSDRASILESINKGRRGVMPAFEGSLKPEEIKAVSVYVYSRGRK